MSTNVQTVPTDRILQSIDEPRRRKVLQPQIENGDEPVPIDELVAGIADRDVPPEDDKDPIERSTIELHHVQLPKLAGASLVNADRRCATVRYQPHGAVEELLLPISEIPTEAEGASVGDS